MHGYKAKERLRGALWLWRLFWSSGRHGCWPDLAVKCLEFSVGRQTGPTPGTCLADCSLHYNTPGLHEDGENKELWDTCRCRGSPQAQYTILKSKMLSSYTTQEALLASSPSPRSSGTTNVDRPSLT